jgi:hypothetical protein
MDVPVADLHDTGQPRGQSEASDLPHLGGVPLGQRGGTEDHEQGRPGQGPGKGSEHIRLRVQPGDREHDRRHDAGLHARDLDDADALEVQSPLEHRQRHDPHSRDQEHGRQEAEECRRLLPEQRRRDQRDDEQRDEGQSRADEQREHRRALDVCAFQLAAAHERAADALVRQGQRKRADDRRHRDHAVLRRRDEVREDDGRADGRHLGGEASERRPAQALEGRFLELAP